MAVASNLPRNRRYRRRRPAKRLLTVPEGPLHAPDGPTSPDGSTTPPASSPAPTSPTNSEQLSTTVPDASSTVLELAGSASVYTAETPVPDSLSSCWIVDTGATLHMTPHRHWFEEYTPFRVPVRCANGTVVFSAGIGAVRFLPVVNGSQSRVVVFHKVLHVPELTSNLLSVPHLVSNKLFKVVMEGSSVEFWHDSQVVFTASLRNKIAYLNGTTQINIEQAHLSSSKPIPLSFDLWHCRLSHVNLADLKRLVRDDLADGIVIDDPDTLPSPLCEPCIAGKQHRHVNKKAQYKAKVPLEIVHGDLHGPMPVATSEGYRYWATFVDDCTNHWFTYFMHSKDQAPKAFWAFKAAAELATGYKVQIFHDDKEGGWAGREFNDGLKTCGIRRQFTMRAEPHSNGKAERAMRSISDDATAILFESNLPPSFWSRAVAAVNWKHNRTPCSSNPNHGIPHTLFYGRRPDLSLARVFGSLAYVHVKKDKRKGLSPHFEKAIFVGYPSQHKGWEFYNPLTKRCVLSDGADFDENTFPGIIRNLPDPSTLTSARLPAPSNSTPNTTTRAMVEDSDDEDEDAHHVLGVLRKVCP